MSTQPAIHPTQRVHLPLAHRPRPSRARRFAVWSLLASAALSGCKGKKDGPSAPTVVPGRSTIIETSNPGYIEARTSQIVTNGALPSTVFDDFTPTSGYTIRSIQWQGIYCVQQKGAAAPAPTASAFTVKFYTDVSGRPNVASPVASETFTIAQVAQTFDKNVPGLNCGSAPNTTWPFYRYAVTLRTPVVVAAGTKYWLSVQATTPSYDVYWGWRDGAVDNRSSLVLFNGAYTTYPVDRAYSLAP